MVFLLQRAGRLKDFEKCLQAAQKASPQPAEKVAGFRFCRGIYYRWTNRPQEVRSSQSLDSKGSSQRHGVEQLLSSYRHLTLISW